MFHLFTGYIDLFFNHWWLWPVGIPVVFVTWALFNRFRRVPFRTGDAGLNILYSFTWPVSLPVWFFIQAWDKGMGLIGSWSMRAWRFLAEPRD